jgi:hypothetical protein
VKFDSTPGFDGELVCRWRRIGDHGVFKSP